MRSKKHKILLMGPLPPPYMGPSLATEILLGSRLGELFDLVHMDTSHHEDHSTLGKIALKNLIVALKQYYYFVKKLVIYKPDIVYIPNCQTSIGYLRDSVFILISKIFMKKVVCHLRGGNFMRWYMSSAYPMKLYVKVIHRLVDVQIVLGETLRKLFDGIVPNEKIFVVPNGRDFDWPEKNIKKTDVDKTNIKILFLSNFIKTKGVLDVLHSIPIVLGEVKNVEFIFAGAWRDDEVKEEMLNTINSNPGYPINIVGKIAGDEKFKLIRSSDIFVLPTYYPPEGHPWSIVEAMAAGMPVISTDQGAILESVINGVNGYIVEKRNHNDIAEKIISFCKNRGLIEKMGMESRKLYEMEFTEKKMVNRISDAFNAAIAS